jgi:hypothetical protein
MKKALDEQVHGHSAGAGMPPGMVWGPSPALDQQTGLRQENQLDAVAVLRIRNVLKVCQGLGVPLSSQECTKERRGLGLEAKGSRKSSGCSFGIAVMAKEKVTV